MNIYSLFIGAALGMGGTVGAYEVIEATCEGSATQPVKWTEAQRFTADYLTAASPHLRDGNGNILKGWYMEKCWIDELFAHYPQADGLQIYIGWDDANSKNNLVWMASAPWNNNGVMERQNLNDDGTVLDLTAACPTVCPTKNVLP
jgi:hypothetical protein